MNCEIYLIIGHRGTGKTTWVKSLKKYFEPQTISIFDIDQEIEKQTQQTISYLFLEGEDDFRKIENEITQKCIQKAQSLKVKVLISLGAGYTGAIPSFCKVIHLKRLSDQLGRIFFDRPRILSHLNSFDEYQELYSKRKLLYANQRDVVWTRLDYFQSLQKWDEVFWDKSLPFTNGVLTLSEKNCSLSQEKLEFFLDQKLKWGLKYFEIKDHEVSNEFLKKILKKIPLHKRLLSFREQDSSLFEKFLTPGICVDWPLEWGVESKILKKYQKKISLIYSLHDRHLSESLEKILGQFPKEKNVHFKLAVNIFSFEELWRGHLWQKEDPDFRSFHPRSMDGRWKWYRLLFGPHQPIYFIREDDEQGILDQPMIAESIQLDQGISQKGFACVLGNPIEHSATPFEQQLFFEKYDLPVAKILMKEEEMNSVNLRILENFGMKFSAVTSPLKKQADNIFKKNHVQNKNEKLKVYKNNSSVSSVNTLILTNKGWCGYNTDQEGALALRKYIETKCKTYHLNQKENREEKLIKNMAVWGGGGVRDILDEALSSFLYSVSFYSARSGKLLKGQEQDPDIVIWAVGRSRMSACIDPPQHWKPLWVFDLNYTEDSPGREYALKTQSEYVSGWLWFQAQAQTQRNIFEQVFNL